MNSAYCAAGWFEACVGRYVVASGLADGAGSSKNDFWLQIKPLQSIVDHLLRPVQLRVSNNAKHIDLENPDLGYRDIKFYDIMS
jgi:hypothetical protein